MPMKGFFLWVFHNSGSGAVNPDCGVEAHLADRAFSFQDTRIRVKIPKREQIRGVINIVDTQIRKS